MFIPFDLTKTLVRILIRNQSDKICALTDCYNLIDLGQTYTANGQVYRLYRFNLGCWKGVLTSLKFKISPIRLLTL